ncbi:MAG: hypothetical protein UV68_C0001G0034 [Candidatus Collierbacteria bacterium GW2011_GWC2_43_12]|uniref:Uncharacterized protein n=1 Tax=Candidatus Collierbacteria bacterium GW2011_GWC2_43_12 TaxID=1618390 RepID=A0A0G1G7G1_9BACT|nr:MAG: hypothetical protein UV68_C0001G0034 [Candidatus Collierbacteria bacterium GW2011_GWC2_43_12]KKT84155.1 MAG: hypothetical protein UW80_C0001G0035 [Microgenomates group bacterium GW2011_GWC1_44_9]
MPFMSTKNHPRGWLSGSWSCDHYSLIANLAASEGSPTTGGAFLFRTGFVNNDVATIKVGTIHFFDSTLSSFSVFEFDESESLTPAGELI